MAVEVDTFTSKTQDQTTPITLTHTVGVSGQNRLMVVGICQRMGVPTISACTYGGVAMTLAKQYGAGPEINIYYLIDPPTGANTISVTHVGNTAKIIFGLSLFGVHLEDPIGAEDDVTGTGTSNSMATASNLGDLVVSMLGKRADDNDNFIISAGIGGGGGGSAIEICDLDMNDVTNDGEAAAGYSSASIASSSHLYQWSTSRAYYGVLLIINKAVEPAIAPITYFIDAWERSQVIRDYTGKHVHRHQIRPNNWIKVTGLEDKLGRNYDNFYDDPAVAFIESVTYDVEGDIATIITNKGALPEVLLATLAAGSLG